MNMKELRERKGLTREEVAARLGKSESTIRFWENGRNTPKLLGWEIPEVLKAYECSVEEWAEATKDTYEKYKR